VATVPLPHRVSALEQALIDLAHAQAQTSAEMREFKDEMGAFKDEMREFKDEMREFKDEMRAFKDEMRASADRADQRWGKQWGELANKMGTLVEDIVFPGIAPIFRRLFPDQGAPDCALRVTRQHPVERGRSREFDAVATAGDAFLVVETKNRLAPDDVHGALARLGEVREFFPEARERRVFGALASFHVDPSLVRAGERQGLLMLGLDTGLLRILNTPEFPPRAF
jgi:hypothetical protein